jgi:hypothetical protein
VASGGAALGFVSSLADAWVIVLLDGTRFGMVCLVMPMTIGDGASSPFALADATDRENRLTASDDPRIGAAAPGMRDA